MASITGLRHAFVRRVPAVAALLAGCLPCVAFAEDDAAWTERELRILQALRLPAAQGPPPAPSNRYADDQAAATLGKRLFFDDRLSSTGEISCASCHRPELYFTDGRPRSRGTGRVMRNAPTVVGAAYQRWFYWDGRRDSLWSQALIPFEAEDEMGASRVHVLRVVGSDDALRAEYEIAFGEFPLSVLDPSLPANAGPYGGTALRNAWSQLDGDLKKTIDRAYSNLGKAIAAFERTLEPPETRFDRYVETLMAGREPDAGSRLDDEAIAGAKLFMDADKTQCLQCHNGPMLTNGDFHNIGTGNFTGEHRDYGRVFGLRAVLMDEFNCLGPYSDAEPAECVTLRFLNRDSHVPLEGAFKVPSLRGLEHTAPYFHDGRFATLREVLDYYNDPPPVSETGPHELRPLQLSRLELDALEAFLLTLSH